MNSDALSAMGSRKFLTVVLLLACSRFSDARYLWGDDAQKPAEAETNMVEELHKGLPMESSQEAARLQPKQTMNATNPFSWKFPEDPVDVANTPEKFDLYEPMPANSLAVRCGESEIQVEVYPDLLGLGKSVKPEDLTLGGCSSTEVDDSSGVLRFKTELHGCGSNLMITEDSLIYAFTLVYNPQDLGDFLITRTGSSVVGIECRYQRANMVSSDSLTPSWMSYKATKVAKEQLPFSLRLMTDDWQFERPSNQYLLGDFLNMEASVMQYEHVPLRVFVDSCVATLEPGDNAVPGYAFIMNHGCLVDARITGSSSQFMPRSQDDKLQFQLEAFRFLQQLNTSLIYITCQLKAIAALSPRDIEHKECSFKNGWEMVGGNDDLCGCCESTCGMRRARDVAADAEEQWHAEVILGPIDIQEE